MLPKRVGLATVSVPHSMSVLDVSNERFDVVLPVLLNPVSDHFVVSKVWLIRLGLPDRSLLLFP